MNFREEDLRAELAVVRKELLDQMAAARAVDESLQLAAHLQVSLKAAITLSLDHLDKIDSWLRTR